MPTEQVVRRVKLTSPNRPKGLYELEVSILILPSHCIAALAPKSNHFSDEGEIAGL
jgi:hypothetical protein